MAVISLASSKGGCGKSTAAVILAGAFAEQGYAVRIIDADPRARIMRWAESGHLNERITVASATAHNIASVVRDAEQIADIVIIDVEGSGNMVVPLSIAQSNLVIIPANQSAPDVEDAIMTAGLVKQTFTASGSPPPFGLIWSRASFAFRSQEIAAIESDVANMGIPVIGTIYDRTAYKALFSYGTTLDKLPLNGPKTDKAREEAFTLANAVSEIILQAQAKAA